MNQNSDKDIFVVSCNCGCGDGMQFCFLDDMIHVSCFESLFYTKQRTLFSDVSDFVRHVKNRCFFDIIVNGPDLIELKYFLRSFRCTNEPVENKLHLTVSSTSYDDGPPVLGLSMDGVPTIKDVITRKTHRMYEFEMNESARISFIAFINEVLNL